MTKAEIASIVQVILAEHFNVETTPTMKNVTLEKLNKNFKILGFLFELERLIQLQLKKEILIIEHFSASIHTVEDLIELVFKNYDK